MYVYLITNNTNHKQYVGITNDYKRRWSNECTYPAEPKKRQVIQEAIHKYGKDNFTFEVLQRGLSIEDAVREEANLIRQLNTLTPNGYNVDPGGSYNPHGKSLPGEQNGRAILTDAEAQYILDNHDKPLYVLYDEFSDRISYEEFRAIYNGKKFSHLTTTTPIYPYNVEFSSQFTSSKLDYDEIVSLRKRYNQGEYWKNVYQEYKDIYPDQWTFWNVYNGNSFSLVMPEVFTEDNKKKHSSLARAGANNGRAKLTEDDVRKIRQLHNEGVPNKELYALYPQVSTTSIRDIINFKTWKKVL